MALIVRTFKKDFERKQREFINPIIEEEINDNLIVEKITKEQKRLGQIAMANDALKPIKKLSEYLSEKWNNKKRLSIEEMKKKKDEYNRFKEVKKIVEDYMEELDNPPSVKKYIKSIFGNNADEKYIINNSNKFGVGIAGGLPQIFINQKTQNTPEFNLQNKKSELIKILHKYLVTHEIGHVFECFKDYIETGNGNLIPSDIAFEKGDYKELLDSEGKASAYALDNMAKSDRMELLKNSSIKRKTLDRAKDKAERIMAKQPGKVEQLDFYRAGTEKYSKTIKDTLKSVDKIKQYKKEIREAIKKINDNEDIKTIEEDLYYFDDNNLYCDIKIIIREELLDMSSQIVQNIIKKAKKISGYYDYDRDGARNLILTFKENSAMDRFNKIGETNSTKNTNIFNY